MAITINLNFNTFIDLRNQWKLKKFYIEGPTEFRLFMFMEAQIFSTTITMEEIKGRFGSSIMVLELFKATYLSDSVKIESIDIESNMLSKDIKIDASDLKNVLDGFLNDFKKFTLTSTGGQGTAGYAMIPVRLGSGKIRRCESCGQILLSGEDACPACGSERLTDKDVEMEMKKWIGFDFVGDIAYMLKFLETYDFGRITTLDTKQKKTLKQMLIDSITQGWTLNKLENEIETVTNDEDSARMIARTEILVVANQGAVLHYEDKGIEKVRWLAVPSAPGGRTCDKCLALNGKEFLIKDIKDKLVLHPFCRCTISAVIE
jgi:SPP1 gp7 family putative phage head morphogenesis protein